MRAIYKQRSLPSNWQNWQSTEDHFTIVIALAFGWFAYFNFPMSHRGEFLVIGGRLKADQHVLKAVHPLNASAWNLAAYCKGQAS